MQRINHFISLFTGLLVLFLAGSAFLLSFEALEDLAIQTGVSEQKAWLYPAIIDGAIIIFSLSVLRANLNRERTLYPWALVSLFTILSVVLNIIHAEQMLLAQFLAAIPPIALFLSFELLLTQLKATAMRVEALHSLNEINQAVRGKKTKLDALIQERSEIVEALEAEIGRLEQRKAELAVAVKPQLNGKTAQKASDSGTIERARKSRTTKKKEAMKRLLEIIQMKPNATLSGLAAEIGRSKSTVGGYMSELQGDKLIEKDANGWKVL